MLLTLSKHANLLSHSRRRLLAEAPQMVSPTAGTVWTLKTKRMLGDYELNTVLL
jgi:hypothetical protein